MEIGNLRWNREQTAESSDVLTFSPHQPPADPDILSLDVVWTYRQLLQPQESISL